MPPQIVIVVVDPVLIGTVVEGIGTRSVHAPLGHTDAPPSLESDVSAAELSATAVESTSASGTNVSIAASTPSQRHSPNVPSLLQVCAPFVAPEHGHSTTAPGTHDAGVGDEGDDEPEQPTDPISKMNHALRIVVSVSTFSKTNDRSEAESAYRSDSSTTPSSERQLPSSVSQQS
jgi:hypothetical protein